MLTKFKISLSAALIVIMLIACNDPVPTELINPDNELTDDGFELELLSPEPEQYVYSNGYDSTGIVNPVPGFASLINISHVKNTLNNITKYRSGGLAIFYDTTRAVRSPNGRVVGFKARILGKVTFNGDTAAVLPYQIQYLDRGLRKDTLLGFRHILYKESFSQIGNSFLPYGTNVEFKLDAFSGNKKFMIPVPDEISGRVNVVGKRFQKDFRLELFWNGLDKGRTELIIGGLPIGRADIFPILRLRTRDDGKFVIPKHIVDRIPFEKFDKIVVTFLRKNESYKNENSIGRVYIAAQSIHNIIFDIR